MLRNLATRVGAGAFALSATFGTMIATGPPAAASGYCRTPYFSGHSAYMTCIGYGYAAFTIRCSSFGFWLGRGDWVLTRAGTVNGSRTFEAYCGWNSWPAQIKGYQFV